MQWVLLFQNYMQIKKFMKEKKKGKDCFKNLKNLD